MREVPQIELDEGGGGGQVHLRRQVVEQVQVDAALLENPLERGLLDLQLLARHLDGPLRVIAHAGSNNVVGSDGEGGEHVADVQRQDGSQQSVS